MHVRIRTRHLRPDTSVEAIQVWQEKMGPFLRQQKGFKGVYLAEDRSTGANVSISLWESEADAAALDDSRECRQLVEMLRQYEEAPSSQGQYEIVLQV